MIEKKQQGSGIHITAKKVNIGTLLNNINRSRISIGQSGAEDDLKKAVLELTEAIARLAESAQLTEDEQQVLSDDIENLVKEAGKPPAERKQGIIRRALDSVLTFAEQAAAAGTPIVDLIIKVQGAFGG